MSLAETAKKLGISFYAFVFDRIAKLNVIPALASVLMQREASAVSTSPPPLFEKIRWGRDMTADSEPHDEDVVL